MRASMFVVSGLFLAGVAAIAIIVAAGAGQQKRGAAVDWDVYYSQKADEIACLSRNRRTNETCAPTALTRD